MQPPALDRTGDQLNEALTIPETTRRVSAVLATYNRCPFDPATHPVDNPLTWALDTLLAQAGGALREIIVVDDASTDHTPDVLARYTGDARPVPVVAIRQDRHCGATIARNTAIGAAAGDLLLFGDDDCVFRPHYAAGAAYLFTRLRQSDPDTCGVTLPFYYRALWPRETVPTAEIGRLQPETARFSTRFHAYPAEYLPTPPLLDEASGLVAPLRVELINGTCLLDAEAVRQVGGFADLSAWQNSYSDHLTLAADLAAAGGHLYHCPDPRLAAPHLKFGARGRFPIAVEDLDTPVEGLGRAFGELVALSEVPRTDTGCRTSPREFFVEMIGSFFAFFATRSPIGGQAWGVRTHAEFVDAGIVHSLSVDATPGHAERLCLWREGLRRGARFAAEHPAPGVPPADVQAVLDTITATVRQPRISSW